jgi:hypothetical protein
MLPPFRLFQSYTKFEKNVESHAISVTGGRSRVLVVYDIILKLNLRKCGVACSESYRGWMCISKCIRIIRGQSRRAAVFQAFRSNIEIKKHVESHPVN